MSSQTHPSGTTNNNVPERECLNVVLEHPGAPNRWRRTPQDLPKGSQEIPKRHGRATKTTRSEAKRAPKSTLKGTKRATASSKANVDKQTEMTVVKIVLSLRRGHDFRCQRRGDKRTSLHSIFGAPAGPLEIPWVLRCAQKTLTMINSACIETMYCFSSRFISVKTHRTGRLTPCVPSSGRF